MKTPPRKGNIMTTLKNLFSKKQETPVTTEDLTARLLAETDEMLKTTLR